MTNSRIIPCLIVTILLGTHAAAAQDSAGGAYKPGGMWMPQQIAETHGETLKKMGLQLDPQVFADPLQFPLNAIVSAGASASFVSPEGLIATNHHCVRGALQFNSTPQRNLLKEGYVARSHGEELYSGPGSRVYVTTSVTDVTQRMRKGLAEIKDDLKRDKELEKREKEIVAEAEAAEPNVRCRLAGFYGGLKYYLITQLEIRDARLVYAPHEGVGFFGGDADNWMWPRHCGDFALLRAYVGPDGKPAEHAKDNVPYKPKSWLKLAREGVKEGDLVFVAGYPGRTQRLATAGEIEERIRWSYPRSIAMSQKHIDTLHRVADGDEDLSIKAAGSIFGLENGEKKSQGILQSAEAQGIVGLKQKEEKELTAWIEAKPERGKKYGEAIKKLNALLADERKDRETDEAVGYFGRGSTLLGVAMSIVRMAEERPKPDVEREPGYQQRDWKRMEQRQERMNKTYADEIEKAVFALYLKEATSLPSAKRPKILNDVFGRGEVTQAEIEKQIEAWMSKTKLRDLDTRLKLLREAKLGGLKKSGDAFIRLALRYRPYQKEREEKSKRLSGAMALLRPVYYEALLEMRGGNVAPDANGTIRVTFGTVRGYRAAPDKPVCKPFTNVWQMVEKWGKFRNEPPYNAPKRVIDAISAGRFGPYATQEAGGVPVDFLSDVDITGGNSGSATLNARGEVVGLVFDGNIEGVASDILFLEETTRGIHVDVRYFEWMLDAVEDAGHLLREMGVEPVFSNRT
jgi:hypothetical protein